MNNKTIFAYNLRKCMADHNKSRKQICEDLNISYYTFSDWVNGKKYPRMDKVELLANYFGITKSDLIERSDPVQTDSIPTDITSEMQRLLNELNNTQHEMTVDGTPLDKDTRELLIASLENSLKVAKMMSNRNEG